MDWDDDDFVWLCRVLAMLYGRRV